jgi:acyl-CoA thioester hydrolase
VKTLVGKEFTFPVTVEFEDVDSYRIAHHVRFVLFLERARVHYFAELGFAFHDNEFNAVLYHLDVQYKKPAFLLDRLEVSVHVQSIDTYRLVLGYKVKRGDELIAKASTTLAFVETATKRLIPVPGVFLRGREPRD